MGKFGMTTAQFEKTMASFKNARDQFRQDMKCFSEERIQRGQWRSNQHLSANPGASPPTKLGALSAQGY